MAEDIFIAGRFNGPPDSGNGGYCGGLLAEHLLQDTGDITKAVHTRLHAPIPLDKDLQLKGNGDGLGLFDDEQVLISAWCEELALDPPARPDLSQVKAAAENFRREGDNPFRHCFGCGEARPVDDAVRVLAGRFPDEEYGGKGYAADHWWADPAFGDERGHLQLPYVWTALDCSGALAAQHFTDAPMLTGMMHVKMLAPVPTGQYHTVLAWPLGEEGRKITTGTAIYDSDGEVLALARLLWITLRRE